MKKRSYCLLSIVSSMVFALQLSAQGYQYCYCPKGDISNGIISSRVLKFDIRNINAIEILVTKPDGSKLGTSNLKLSADGPLPNGRLILSDPVLDENSATIKYTSRIFSGNEKSVQVYINFTSKETGNQYLGPFTIYRDAITSTSFQQSCNDQCPEKKDVAGTPIKDIVPKTTKDNSAETGKVTPPKTTKDTSPKQITDTSRPELAHWRFQSPKTMTIQKASISKDQLQGELSDLRIIPNPSMLKLLNSLNKGLSEKGNISRGETLKLPEFPVVSNEKVTQFNHQYVKDINTNENESILALEKIKLFFNLLGRLKSNPNYNLLDQQLRDVQNVFGTLLKTKMIFQFMSFQVNTINYELEDFNNSLLDMMASRQLSKADLLSAELFSNDMVRLINPLLGKYEMKLKPWKPVNRDYTQKIESGPFVVDENVDIDDYNMDEEAQETYFDATPQLPIYFYVFEADGTPAKELYSVYCVPKYMYNRYTKNGNLGSVHEFRALGKASTAFMTLESSFERYFFAVSQGGKISEVQLFQVYKIPKDPTNPAMTKPYSFPIYMGSQ